jgi:DNA-binding transcriptional MerR regulator
MSTTLLSIGEFSRLTHLSIKALRHYHDVDLLAPAHIDPGTGYRRYVAEQLPDAHLIRRLRDLDMPLDEVRTVLHASDEHERDQVLAVHLERMEQQLDRTRAVVTSLRELLEAPKPPFDVSHRRIDATIAVAIRGHVVIGEAEQWWPSAFETLDAALRTGGVAPAGPPGALFTADLFEQGQGEVVAFMPIAEEVDIVPPVDRIQVDGGRYAVALHRGPYVDLDRTYGALGSYVAEHAIGAAGLIREQYLVGPVDAIDPAHMRTEVCWPIS